MKAKTKSFAVGLLVILLTQGVGLTATAEPASQSGSPKPQPQEKGSLAKTTAFRLVGDAHTALTSSDGVSWNTLQTQGETNCRGMTWANGIFVKVGLSNVIRTSIDGVVWTSRSSSTPLHSSWGCLRRRRLRCRWQRRRRCDFGGRNRVDRQNSGTEDRLRCIAYGDGIFVAVGYSGTIITSNNGVRWTSRNSGTDHRLQSIAYGNRTFVAVGRNGLIVTSKHGHAWRLRNSGTSSHLWSVTCTDGNPDPMFFSCFVRPNLVGTALPPINGQPIP